MSDFYEHAMIHSGGRVILHTERGDVELTGDEYAVYNILARDRFRVMTRQELATRTALSGRQLDACCAALHSKIKTQTGLDLVCNVWGVGYRLETCS